MAGAADVVVRAGGDITLASAIDTSTSTHNSTTTKSGVLSAPGGGLGYAIGKQEVKDGTTTTTTTNQGSLIGSIGGNVAIGAGGDFKSTASVLVAPSGDLTVVAKFIAVAAGIDTATTTSAHSDRFSGAVVSYGIGGPAR